jgi:hypothetical protein
MEDGSIVCDVVFFGKSGIPEVLMTVRMATRFEKVGDTNSVFMESDMAYFTCFYFL